MNNIKQIIEAIKKCKDSLILKEDIQKLNEYKPSPEQECGCQKMKLIHLAASQSKVESLQYFVENFQNLEITDSIGRTPLHYAINYGLIDNAKLLIQKGANIEAQTLGGDTPLIKSALLKRKECYQYLISKGANKQHQNLIGQSAEQIQQYN